MEKLLVLLLPLLTKSAHNKTKKSKTATELAELVRLELHPASTVKPLVLFLNGTAEEILRAGFDPVRAA